MKKTLEGIVINLSEAHKKVIKGKLYIYHCGCLSPDEPLFLKEIENKLKLDITRCRKCNLWPWRHTIGNEKADN